MEDPVIHERSEKTMFTSTTSANGTLNNEKYSKMKKVVNAIEAYLITKAEDKVIIINKNLQALSFAIDTSQFDPHTNIAAKFFISLHDLMHILEPRSLTSWYCVDVLTNACKNHAAREALIKSYQFLPCLARMVGDQLTNEKKTRLLKLIQNLTFGIKIYWQIPNLTHLMSTLCKWVEKEDPDTVTLSLGVLVNLCYKNVSAIYILHRHVDLKKFLRMCLALRGPFVEAYVCQISIILENVSGYVPAEVLPKLIDSTFVAVIEALKKEDCVLLKQVVEIFSESIKNNQNNALNVYSDYGEKVDSILQIIDSLSNNKTDSTRLPDYLVIVFELLHFLIDLQVPQISSQYFKIIPIALKWIQEPSVSYQALAVLKTIAVNDDKKDKEVMKSLVVGLPMFLFLLNSSLDDGQNFNTDHSKRIGALLQLLKAMIHLDEIRRKVTQELDENSNFIKKIFLPLLGDESPRSDEVSCSTDRINLCVYALALLSDLVDCNRSWLVYMNDLLENKQIHVILAQAICRSSPQVKKLALDLSNRSCSDGVSLALSNFQSIIATGNESCSHISSNSQPNDSFILISIKQNERLDCLLEKFENLVARNDMSNSSISELMELYNYKLSYLAQAERSALASVETATKYCSHLQHRIEGLIAAQTRSQQSEFNTMKTLEETMKKNDKLNVTVRELQNKIEAEKGKSTVYNSQLQKKEKALGECEVQLRDTENKLMEITKAKNSVDEQFAKLQQTFKRVEENYRKLEKSIQKKEEMLKSADARIHEYTVQVHDLEKSLKDTQKQLDETTAALKLKSSILENITKMANSQI